jgi:hypothetical protein
VEELCLPTQELDRPWKVHNINKTDNRLGEVTKEVWMRICHEDHDETHRFLIADIREDDIILGYPFFKAANLLIDWPVSRMRGTVTMTEVRPPSKNHPPWINQITTLLKKTTVTQQLMEQATNKKEQTWEELVPEQYHKFSSIFSEKDSKQFPEPRKWNHTINLKADAPTSIDCCVYPLSPKEKEEQKEFLTKNLQLK